MTKLEIIDYVVEHYKTNPRSIGINGGCVYNGINGSHCAFGLMCSNPEELTEGEGVVFLIRGNIPRIKPEFSGHSEWFYVAIQLLHDYGSYWEETPEGNELTQKGIKEVEKLKERYK